MMQDRLLALLIEASRRSDFGAGVYDDDDDKPAYDESKPKPKPKPERKYDDSIDKTYARVKKLLSPVGTAARAAGRGALRVAQSKGTRAVAKAAGKVLFVPTEGQYKRRAAKGLVNLITRKAYGTSHFNTKRPKNKKAQQQDDES